MLFAPDNFLYFVVLFSIAIAGGTYLLFAYYRDKLLLLNALALFLCAVRAGTEYYLPSVESFHKATSIAIFHSVLAAVILSIEWYLIWFYVRPLKGWKWERIANQLSFWLMVAAPMLLKSWWLLQRKVFYFASEKIDGYWQFAVRPDFEWMQFYTMHNQLTAHFGALVMLTGIILNPRHRIRQSILLLSFIILPFIYFQNLESRTFSDWTIPNMAGIIILHNLLISWFVSDYRIFSSNFDLYKKSLLESISDLAISLSPQFTILSYNPKAASVFNFSSENVLSMLQQHSNFTYIELEEKLQPLFKNETDELELSFRSRAGKNRTFSLKIAPFKNNEQIMGYTLLLTDLTEIRAKEAALNQLYQTKDRIFSIIGHDLRKPAIAFRGITQKVNYLLKKQDYATLERFGNEIENDALALNLLTDNLLNWALTQKNVMPNNPQQVEVADIVADEMAVFKKTAAEKRIQLVSVVPRGLLVFADPYALRTIIRNLLDNAIKYTCEGGRVETVVEDGAEGVEIVISDTGVGIPESKLKDIFLLREGKSEKGTAGEKGAGLGLHLVHELVQLNRGAIEVASSPGQGTRFEVRMPRRLEAA